MSVVTAAGAVVDALDVPEFRSVLLCETVAAHGAQELAGHGKPNAMRLERLAAHASQPDVATRRPTLWKSASHGVPRGFCRW